MSLTILQRQTKLQNEANHFSKAVLERAGRIYAALKECAEHALASTELNTALRELRLSRFSTDGGAFVYRVAREVANNFPVYVGSGEYTLFVGDPVRKLEKYIGASNGLVVRLSTPSDRTFNLEAIQAEEYDDNGDFDQLSPRHFKVSVDHLYLLECTDGEVKAYVQKLFTQTVEKWLNTLRQNEKDHLPGAVETNRQGDLLCSSCGNRVSLSSCYCSKCGVQLQKNRKGE